MASHSITSNSKRPSASTGDTLRAIDRYTRSASSLACRQGGAEPQASQALVVVRCRRGKAWCERAACLKACPDPE